jgi:hypothetical protein
VFKLFRLQSGISKIVPFGRTIRPPEGSMVVPLGNPVWQKTDAGESVDVLALTDGK